MTAVVPEAWFLRDDTLKLCVYKLVSETCNNKAEAFTFFKIEDDWDVQEPAEISVELRSGLVYAEIRVDTCLPGTLDRDAVGNAAYAVGHAIGRVIGGT